MPWQSEQTWQLIYKSAAPVTLSDSDGVFETYVLPGGLMGPNSILKLTSLVHCTAGTAVTHNFSWGTLTPVNDRSIGVNAMLLSQVFITNANSLAAQILSTRLQTYNGALASDDIAATENTANDVTITTFSSFTAAGESIQRVFTTIELLR